MIRILQYFPIFWKSLLNLVYIISTLFINIILESNIPWSRRSIIIYNSRKINSARASNVMTFQESFVKPRNHAKWNDSTNFSTKFSPSLPIRRHWLFFSDTLSIPKSFVPGFSTGKRSVSRASIYKRGYSIAGIDSRA